MTAPGTSLPALTDAQIERYSRQIILPEIGATKQQHLLASSVAVAGTSGVATMAVRYLMAAGIGGIAFTDFTPALQTIAATGPDLRCADMATEDTLDRFAALIICDASPATRIPISRAAIIHHKPVVVGHVRGYHGIVATLSAHAPAFPCAECLQRTFESGTSADDVLTPVTGAVIGALVAAETVKIVLGIGSSPSPQFYVYNAATGRVDARPVIKDTACPVCAPTH